MQPQKLLASQRVQDVIDITQIDISGRIHDISDGQRRRCQLRECIYMVDEFTLISNVTHGRAC